MEVKQHMIKNVITCTATMLVLDAVKKMAQHNIGSIVVVQDNSPIGIFTERDLVKRVVALSKDPAKVVMADVMTRELITVNAEESVGSAYHIFVEHNVRHAPVVHKGQLIGIVSQRDLGKVLDDRFYRTYMGKSSKRDLSGAY